MKYSILLPLAATAVTSFVLPDAALTQEILLAEGTIQSEPAHESDGSAWWDDIPSKDEVLSSVQTTVKTTIDSAIEAFGHLSDKVEGTFETLLDAVLAEEDEGDEDEDPEDDGGKHGGHGKHGKHGKHGHHQHGNATKSIYELITESKYTTHFAKALEDKDFSEIADILKDTKANHTLFVPTDKALERIPDHHKDGDHKPSKEFMLAALKYHIAPGLWPARRLAFHHTLPSLYDPGSLGGPQRLRVRASLLSGLRVNFFSKVVAANIVAKNGLIHAVDHVIIPPPKIGRILNALPSVFSTLELAIERTGLGEELHKSGWTGATVFAPPNRAWAKLGPAANAFLFSKRGEKYLAALLKYHIVANETFYSDAYYAEGRDATGDYDGEGEGEASAEAAGRWHFDLPSLLDGKPLSVDVRRWLRFISIRVNGWTSVSLQDGVAADGVIQVVDSVLIPSHKHKKGREEVSAAAENISVEELVERLEPYMKDTAREDVWAGDDL